MAKAAVKPVGKPPAGKPALQFFKTRINGKPHTYGNFEHVQLIRGDQFEIVDVTALQGNASDWVVNFKGFVGDRRNNTGEDRGYVIHTGKDLWARYSLKKQGMAYQIIVTFNKDVIGKLFVDIKDPKHGKKRSPK